MVRDHLQKKSVQENKQMANPNPNLSTRFQKGNQMAKLSIGKKRRQLTASFLNAYTNAELEILAKQLLQKALDPQDPDSHRAKELLMKYSLVPSTQSISVAAKEELPQEISDAEKISILAE